jgi:NAD(P)-dependent dehydrogenase (short-subunit alcohol dehydrogenase family)
MSDGNTLKKAMTHILEVILRVQTTLPRLTWILLKMPYSMLVTGANGSLGSQGVLKIAQHDPNWFFLLAVRNTTDHTSTELASNLQKIGAGLSFLNLDLSSLKSVRECIMEISQQIQSGGIPKLKAIINCAAYQSFTQGT